jgi:hypothetical protein
MPDFEKINSACPATLFVPKGFNTQEPAFRRGNFRARLLMEVTTDVDKLLYDV